MSLPRHNGLPLGRKPRSFNPAVPHFSALKMRFSLFGGPPQAPPAEDYTVGLPADLGMMLNDQLGDCAEAGFFHFVQVWSNAASKILTVPDSCVQQLYEDGAGYVPGDPSTDQGTDLQALLSFLVKTGALMPDGTRHKILAFFEVDPTNDADLNLVTAECGAIYLGFNVPAGMPTTPGSVWSASGPTVGGHCVISPKYPPRGIISWGSDDFSMAPGFWASQVDECYAIVDPLFIEATGRTPFGLSEAVWQEQMAAL